MMEIKNSTHQRQAPDLQLPYSAYEYGNDHDRNSGYVPHREAFLHGGYETTFIGSNRLAPDAGHCLVRCVLELLAREDA